MFILNSIILTDMILACSAHTMKVCGHGIISSDIIPAPNGVSAHLGTECHTMEVCGHGIIYVNRVDAFMEREGIL
jgi:hypothetical protein